VAGVNRVRVIYVVIRIAVPAFNKLIEAVTVVSPRSITYKYSNESSYELPVVAANRD